MPMKTPVPVRAFEKSTGEALCLSNKFTIFHFVGPVALSDDGYVLAIKDSQSYYPLSKARIAELQASGTLPNPMPSYTISKATIFTATSSG